MKNQIVSITLSKNMFKSLSLVVMFFEPWVKYQIHFYLISVLVFPIYVTRMYIKIILNYVTILQYKLCVKVVFD